MKRLLLAIALLFPTAAYAQGTFRGADELRRHQAIFRVACLPPKKPATRNGPKRLRTNGQKNIG